MQHLVSLEMCWERGRRREHLEMVRDTYLASSNVSWIVGLPYRYCDSCMKDDMSRVVTFKTPARKSARKRAQRDYANLNVGLGGSDPNRWLRMMENKVIKKSPFRKMKGSELDSWLEVEPEDAMKEPIIIEKPDGLGMKMPPEGLTVENVAEYVGESVPLEVIGMLSALGSDLSSFDAS